MTTDLLFCIENSLYNGEKILKNVNLHRRFEYNLIPKEHNSEDVRMKFLLHIYHNLIIFNRNDKKMRMHKLLSTL